MTNIDLSDLSLVVGGAADPEQMRSMAQRWCPQTAERYRNAPITRPIAERCLAEAGLSQYRSQLDSYFPPKR